MQRRHFAAWALAAVASVSFAQGKADPAEIAKFQGTWVLVSGKHDGKPIAAENVSKGKVAWKGQDVVVETPHQSKEAIKAKAALGSANGVKTMDFVRSNGPGAGSTMLAIYEFRSPDEYAIVFAAPGKPRPAEMDAKAGSGATMHVWKRQK